LDKTVASLTQLQEEHAEVTHLLIEAKVDNAERKGEQASAQAADAFLQQQFHARLLFCADTTQWLHMLDLVLCTVNWGVCPEATC
jgi:hypothetical protein